MAANHDISAYRYCPDNALCIPGADDGTPFLGIAYRDVYNKTVDSIYSTSKTDPHAYTLETSFTTGLYGIYSESNTSGKCTYMKGPGYLGMLTPSFPTAGIPDINLQYNELLQRMKETLVGSLNLSVSVAEQSQLRRMLKGALTPKGVITRLGQLVRNSRSARGAIQIPANAWLEWTYGWKPFASDLYGICDNLQRQAYNGINTGFKFRSSRGFGGYSQKAVSSQPNFQWAGKGSQRIEIGLAMSNSNFSNNITAWTSLNPLLIAWELVPYSFVVDWFYDIGGYMELQEFQLFANTRFRKGYVTKTIREDMSCRAFGGGTPYYSYAATGKRFRYWIQRTVLTSYPSPTPPRVKCDLGANRLLSAAALLTQMLKR